MQRCSAISSDSPSTRCGRSLIKLKRDWTNICQFTIRAMNSSDRRKHKRVALHWPVRLSRQPGTQPIESTTKNLSSEGFYCITTESFTVGERLQCVIVLPPDIVASESTVGLQCHLTVRRVENLEEGFGLGCHIEDYSLLTGSSQQSPM